MSDMQRCISGEEGGASIGVRSLMAAGGAIEVRSSESGAEARRDRHHDRFARSVLDVLPRRDDDEEEEDWDEDEEEEDDEDSDDLDEEDQEDWEYDWDEGEEDDEGEDEEGW